MPEVPVLVRLGGVIVDVGMPDLGADDPPAWLFGSMIHTHTELSSISIKISKTVWFQAVFASFFLSFKKY